MRYICVAKCHELDINKTQYIHNEEDMMDLLNKECPCGSNSKFVEEESLQEKRSNKCLSF